MKLKKNHNKIKMIAAVALCGFSAISLVSGAIAWFSASRISKDSGDSMTAVEPSPIFKRMSFHNYLHIDYVNSVYKFNQTEAGYIDFVDGALEYHGNASISLGAYDQLNQSQPILCLIELDTKHTVSATDPLVVTAKTDETYIGASEDAIAATGNPLSSVVRFYSTAYEDDDDLGTIEGSYTNDSGTFTVYNVPMAAQATDYGSFALFENEYTYDDFDDNPTLYEADNGDDVTYIAIVFDYYIYALEYIYNTYLGLDILDDTITFTCDWTMVV